MTLTTDKAKNIINDLILIILGSSCLAVSTHVFNAPNNIAPGGVTGISIIVNYLTGLPISLLSFAINVPLIVLAFLFLGRQFTIKTLIAVISLSVSLEVVEAILPVYEGDVILAALYGGIITGFGLGLVFMRGATTGGTDIVMKLIQLKRPDISAGRLMLLLDAAVLVCAALVYRNIENALYALISIFTCSKVIDTVLYGRDAGKLIMIISKHAKELSAKIDAELDRGCTLLPAKGGYTGLDTQVLICALSKNQFFNLKRLVHDLDPAAFMMVLETNEVIGQGFKLPETQEKTL